MIFASTVTGAFEYDGLIGAVANGSLDTVLAEWGMDVARFTAVDYT